MSTTTTTTAAAAAAAEQQTTPEYKVFIGNLSFKTTKEELRSFAEGTGGKVVDTTIITKGPSRSLGYGFVTYATEEDMNKAAVELNHKQLDGREINMEVARPKTVTAVTAESTDNKAPRKRSTRRKSKTSKKKKNVKKETVSSSSSDEETKAAQTKKQQQASKKQEASTSKDSLSDTTEDLPTHRQTPKKKKTKQQKKARSSTKEDRPTSKTTLFVANLPYATTDDDIKQIFEGYKVISAHVTRMNNGRSKGYGFVEFEDEDEQQKALQNVKDIQMDGRAVYLKVALSTDEVSKKVEALDINDTKK